MWHFRRQLGDGDFIAAATNTLQLGQEVVLVALAAAVDKQLTPSLRMVRIEISIISSVTLFIHEKRYCFKVKYC